GGRGRWRAPGRHARTTEHTGTAPLSPPARSWPRRGPAGAAASEAPGAVLEPGRLDACGPGDSNCTVSKAASALLYCGVVRTCAEGACFQGQTADIRPDDVAASLYYYQALAQAKTPSSIAPAACGAVPMSIHLSTLISEAATAPSPSRFPHTHPP